jgi:hypothetical protein
MENSMPFAHKIHLAAALGEHQFVESGHWLPVSCQNFPTQFIMSFPNPIQHVPISLREQCVHLAHPCKMFVYKFPIMKIAEMRLT